MTKAARPAGEIEQVEKAISEHNNKFKNTSELSDRQLEDAVRSLGAINGLTHNEINCKVYGFKESERFLMSNKEFQRKEVATKEIIINATFYNSLGDKIVEIKDLRASAYSVDENNIMTIKPFSDYNAEIILDIGRLYNIEISTKEVVTKKWTL